MTNSHLPKLQKRLVCDPKVTAATKHKLKRREALQIALLGLIACELLLGATTRSRADEPRSFITRRGDKLYDGAEEYRFISFNIPNLMVIEDAFEFRKPNPWRWPNEYEIEDALESVRQMGGRVVRTYVLSVYREGSDMGECVHVRRPGEFNEEGFIALDKVMEIAGRKGIRVILPFVDKGKWWGGIAEYAAFRNKPAEAFWYDRQVKDDFKATIRYLLTRKNTYTGIVYRDDPAVFGWETGNEIRATPEWTREISAYIKQLDHNHLVIDGKSLDGVPLTSLEDPNVDVITTHHYPWGGEHDFVEPIRAAHAVTKGKKAYLVGELGFVETPYIARAIQTVVDDGISGALLWSLRMHRREGGFYWHMEIGTGRNVYKAFHWPGFASGDRYDERAILKLVRENAYAIRGREAPRVERPRAPRLLPIEKVSAISWQGSAGASAYDVWRATSEAGPWNRIASDVSDAEYPYQPLLNDETAEPGQKYWYRIVARNAGGESASSNVVGPVAVDCRTLVDECRDFSLTAATAGQVTVTSENPRAAQEDSHRFAYRAGSSVTYKVRGPIGRYRIYSFARGEERLAISLSADGKSYQRAKPSCLLYSPGQTVYGYLTPIMYSGEPAGGDFTYLKISLPNAVGDRSEAGTTSAIPSSQPAPLELARVEIEYGRRAKPAATRARRSPEEATQLNSSIFVDGCHRIDDALQAIDAAALRGERQLNVVVTTQVDLTEDLRIKTFGEFRGPELRFAAMNNVLRDERKSDLRQVFDRMVERNLDISILPHIDAGGKVRAWRNSVDFDPLESYGGYSYADLVLTTIVEALAGTVSSHTHIDLALSGEMGTSLFRYPDSYRAIIRQLRSRGELKDLRIGISLNHNSIAGRAYATGVKGAVTAGEQRRQMQSLIDDCDFVGISFYSPTSVSPTTEDFVRGIERYMAEFNGYGLKVPTTKPLQFSEVGIGGGRLRIDESPDPVKAAQSPWEGAGTRRDNPWRHEVMRKLRLEFHKALLEFLREQPASWHVSAAFLWSMSSWDPVGFREPEFADPEIAASIERHNRAVR